MKVTVAIKKEVWEKVLALLGQPIKNATFVGIRELRVELSPEDFNTTYRWLKFHPRYPVDNSLYNLALKGWVEEDSIVIEL